MSEEKNGEAEMLDEYDFSEAEVGKFARQYAKGTSNRMPISQRSKRKMDWSPIIVALVSAALGALLGMAGTFYLQGREIENLKAQVENLKSSRTNSSSNTPNDQQIEIKAKPERLINIIKDHQRVHVKQSCGEFAYQSFTQRDLDEFKKKDISKQITDELKQDGEFLEVVLAIKRMSLGDQRKLLDQASKTYRPTWAEQGKISCEGQTETGQEAEKIIAGSIVQLVKDLTRSS